jgi:hypothetical protein
MWRELIRGLHRYQENRFVFKKPKAHLLSLNTNFVITKYCSLFDTTRKPFKIGM